LSFLCNFLDAPFTFLEQAWAEGKGELAMSRLRADCGRETDSLCIAIIYIDRIND
jgi:hypothetical protein